MKSYCLTDTGKKRNMNQDFVYASEQRVGAIPNLFIVADGMGGHNAGDLASRLAVETMVDHIGNSGKKRTLTILSEAVDAANRSVYARSLTDKSLTGMGTTVVACCVEGESLYVVNVGDSRLYVIRDDIYQVTRDHSLVEEMVKAGTISRKQARTHPEETVITRAIGAGDQLRVDLFRFPLRPGEKILMCTDGLTNMLTDEEILQILSGRTDYDEAAQALVESANRAGGKDNITVLIADPHPAGREGSDD